jgi:K+-transporting ATPase KdpF subunit
MPDRIYFGTPSELLVPVGISVAIPLWSHRVGLAVSADHSRELRSARAGREGSRAAMSSANVIGLILSVLLVGYLIIALIIPEKF